MLRPQAVVVALAIWVASPAAAQDAFLLHLYGEGVHTYFRGDYAGANETFTTAVDAGLEDARCFYFRGLTRARLGRDSESQADFQRGADLEGASLSQIRMVSLSIQRVQGRARMRLETYREKARTMAYEQVRGQRIELAAQRMKEAEAARHVVAKPVYDLAAVQSEIVALANEYFTALVMKDRDAILPLLTPKASETFAAMPLDVTPSETATFEYGQIEIADDEASLPTMITDGDLKLGGSLLVRFANDRWSIFAQTLTIGPGTPELVLDFEDAPTLIQTLTQLQQAIAATSEPAPANPPASQPPVAARPTPAARAEVRPAAAVEPDPFADPPAGAPTEPAANAKPDTDDPFAEEPAEEMPADDAADEPLGAADEPAEPEEMPADEEAPEESADDGDPFADEEPADEEETADEPAEPEEMPADEEATEESADDGDPFAEEEPAKDEADEPAEPEEMPADEEAPE